MSKHEAVETLASRLHNAEYGAMGQSWDDLSDMAQDEYRRTAGKVFEAWWDSRKPFVVIDLANDEMWLSATAPEPTP